MLLDLHSLLVKKSILVPLIIIILIYLFSVFSCVPSHVHSPLSTRVVMNTLCAFMPSIQPPQLMIQASAWMMYLWEQLLGLSKPPFLQTFLRITLFNSACNYLNICYSTVKG